LEEPATEADLSIGAEECNRLLQVTASGTASVTGPERSVTPAFEAAIGSATA